MTDVTFFLLCYFGAAVLIASTVLAIVWVQDGEPDDGVEAALWLGLFAPLGAMLLLTLGLAWVMRTVAIKMRAKP